MGIGESLGPRRQGAPPTAWIGSIEAQLAEKGALEGVPAADAAPWKAEVPRGRRAALV